MGSLDDTTWSSAGHLPCHAERTEPIRGYWGSLRVWSLLATFSPSGPSHCVTFPWDETACSSGSGGDGRQTLASGSHSFYLLSLGYSTLDSFRECPLGMEASKAELPQLHQPPCPPHPPHGAASARLGPHIHIQDLPSEPGEEAATATCWSPVVGSGGVGARLPECRGGSEGSAHPPGALGS